MAYKTKDLLEQAIEVTKKFNLLFIEDIVSYLPCSKPTFYEHNLNESNELKELLMKNRTVMKQNMRKKWYDSDNPTLNLALYRLIATPEEHMRLNQQVNILSLNQGEETEDAPTIVIQPLELDE